jgi:hypothetical protein
LRFAVLGLFVVNFFIFASVYLLDPTGG